MADISVQAQQRILSAIRERLQDVRTLRASTRAKNGYMGFNLTETTLSELHDVVAKSLDRDQIVDWLKLSDGYIALTGGGAVAPAVKRAREAFKVMWEELEAPPPAQLSAAG
ncbi:MAG TPA: hypothetical protein VEK10_04550 [Steroidobacteraceae bacterium]|nr:hypothetical protein [Steroidobacteraceae bacterium]